MSGIKTKSTGSFAFFFSFGHARVASLANFLFSPTFTWEPVRRLMLGSYTGENLQVT